MNEAHISLIMAHNPFLRVAQLDHVHKDYDKPDDSEKVPDKQAMHAEEPAAAQSQILQLNSLTKWQKKNGWKPRKKVNWTVSCRRLFV